jgi:hypothetical protein
MYYMFWPIAAIIKYIELLQSSFCLLYLPTLATALYRYVVYVMPLCCNIYKLRGLSPQADYTD